MSIKDFIEKIKAFISKPSIYRLFFSLFIMILMVSSFYLGRISIKEANLPQNEGVRIYLPNGSLLEEGSATNQNEAHDGASLDIDTQSTKVFRSKTGKIYYFTSCNSGNRVKVENRIWYNSSEEAEKAGYTLATSCQ